MGKKIEYDTSIPYVYDGSAEAGRRAYARAHADYLCLLCGTMQKAGKRHCHPGCAHQGLTAAKGSGRVYVEDPSGGRAP